MPDKVVERLEGEYLENERELEGNVELGFRMLTILKANKHPLCGSLTVRSMGLSIF